MTLSSTEDTLFIVTSNHQLIKTNIALDGTDEEAKTENVICSFHSDVITGMDTCSKDKTVRIWNYNSKTLEICHPANEEALAVAMHPSGFHIIVAL